MHSRFMLIAGGIVGSISILVPGCGVDGHSYAISGGHNTPHHVNTSISTNGTSSPHTVIVKKVPPKVSGTPVLPPYLVNRLPHEAHHFTLIVRTTSNPTPPDIIEQNFPPFRQWAPPQLGASIRGVSQSDVVTYASLLTPSVAHPMRAWNGGNLMPLTLYWSRALPKNQADLVFQSSPTNWVTYLETVAITPNQPTTLYSTPDYATFRITFNTWYQLHTQDNQGTNAVVTFELQPS